MRFAAAPRKLLWTFVGDPLGADAFGEPAAAATGFALCAYDGAGTAIFSAAVPAGGLCNGAPCWKALGGGAFRATLP